MNKEFIDFKQWLEQQTYINRFMTISHTWDDVKSISWLMSEENMTQRTVDKNKVVNIKWRVEYESRI
jgi:hypothetical protein